MGYMKNMVSHKICFQSPTLQDMATTQFVKKKKKALEHGRGLHTSAYAYS